MAGLLNNTINKIKNRNKAAGHTIVKPKRTSKPTKSSSKKKVNKNKAGIKPTTSKAKAAAQKAAIRRRVAARVAKNKRK